MVVLNSFVVAKFNIQAPRVGVITFDCSRLSMLCITVELTRYSTFCMSFGARGHTAGKRSFDANIDNKCKMKDAYIRHLLLSVLLVKFLMKLEACSTSVSGRWQPYDGNNIRVCNCYS